MKQNLTGVWIPIEILEIEGLNLNEKVLLSMVFNLDNEQGCYASNEYFARFLGVSKDRVSKIISGLSKKGYLKNQVIYKRGTKCVEKRILKVSKLHSTPYSCGDLYPPGTDTDTISVNGAEFHHPPGADTDTLSLDIPTPYSCGDLYSPGTDTEDNNIFNKKIDSKGDIKISPKTEKQEKENNKDGGCKRDFVEQSSTLAIPYGEILHYLNEKMGFNVKAEDLTHEVKEYIKNQFEAGYTLEDFKMMIDRRSSVWESISEMPLVPRSKVCLHFEEYKKQMKISKALS